MTSIFAQGDILLERVDDVPEFSTAPRQGSELVIAEGEFSGHRHSVHEDASLFHDEALALDMPSNLYIGHLVVRAPSATLVHQEHAPITLIQGTYRVRRQREMDPRDARVVAD